MSLAAIQLDPDAELPLYRQLHRQIRERILNGSLGAGERLPATRELAQQLDLNRATVSSAYALLEEDGLIHGHVGRGSFVSPVSPRGAGFVSQSVEAKAQPPHLATSRPLASGFVSQNGVALDAVAATAPLPAEISFATSRPHAGLFPLEQFRLSCQEVLNAEVAHTVLQLGSPLGYAPLRQYLLEDAEARQIGRSNDDILITNGCQQAMDLIARTVLSPEDTVLVEEPIYPGLRSVFAQARVRLIGMPVGPRGIRPEDFARLVDSERPRMAVLTPSFQNPTGATIPAAARHALLETARRAGVLLVENDLYSALRYRGEDVLAIKSLDGADEVVLLGSFSKVAFPGLRVGWVIAPRPFIRKLAEVKQATDLHTDQLSQAVLLRFAESGRLAEHLRHVRSAGLAQLEAAIEGCERYLPAGSVFTRPDGGLNLWVRLPAPLDAGALLSAAQARGVSYLPARYFAVNRLEENAFRLSFGGLTPREIERGLRLLGEVFAEELARGSRPGAVELETALV
jgi:2-aminoadipate transaminase